MIVANQPTSCKIDRTFANSTEYRTRNNCASKPIKPTNMIPNTAPDSAGDLNIAIKQGAKTNIQITEKNYSSIRRNNLSTERKILRLHTVNNCLSRTHPRYVGQHRQTHTHNTLASAFCSLDRLIHWGTGARNLDWLKKKRTDCIEKKPVFVLFCWLQEAHFFDIGVLLNISF